MSAFLKVLVAAAALSAASSNLALAGYSNDAGYSYDNACQDHAYAHCR
jgi:hypothetical protein